MTLSAIPTASPSVPAQHSAISNNTKSSSAASASPERGRDFSDCLNQSDSSAVKPSSTSNKPTTEKNSDKKSASPDADSAQPATPSAEAALSPENTAKTDPSGSQFSAETTTAGTETQTAEEQEAEGGSVQPSSMLNAQDDPWLQQLDVSRKALQSPIASSSARADTDTVNSTGKAGAMGLVDQALAASRSAQGVAGDAQSTEALSTEELSTKALSTEKELSADARSEKMALRADSASKLHTETDLARHSALLFTEDSQQKSADQSTHSADRLSRLSALSAMGNENAVVTPPAQGHDLLAALRQQNAASARIPEHVQAPNTPLPLRNSEQSAQVLHEQVQFLLNRKLDKVEIRLDPPELGNLQIKLQLNQDQAQVSITVHNTQARELLEQTLPRLREMLAQQGVVLGQTQIQQQQQGQAQDQQARGGQAGSGDQAAQAQVLHAAGDAETESLPQKAVSISPYQVDYYA